MTKNEFMDYITFLKKLFPRANMPTDKDALAVWYKAFSNTHINIAKDMAQMYFKEEQGSFNYARLLQYKSRAMAGKAYIEKPVTKTNCKVCKGEGVVIVERLFDDRPYQYAYKCVCRSGELYPSFPPIRKELIENNYLEGGTWKVNRGEINE